MTAEEIVAHAVVVLGVRPEPLCVLWIQHSEKDILAQRIQKMESPVVAMPLRAALFLHPDTVANDVASLLESAKAAILVKESQIRLAGKVCVVVVSHAPFSLPGLSSPIRLPDWFPVAAGTHAAARVEDISGTVDAPLNSTYAQIGILQSGLFALETALAGRIGATAHDRRKCDSLSAQLRNLSLSDDLTDLVKKSTSMTASVSSAESFRPSLKSRESFVCLLWGAAGRLTPEGSSAFAGALASALDLQDGRISFRNEGLLAVLGRPSSPEVASVKFCRGLLATIRASAQWTTASAHADAYRPFPVRLQTALSSDLIQSIRESTQVLTSER